MTEQNSNSISLVGKVAFGVLVVVAVLLMLFGVSFLFALFFAVAAAMVVVVVLSALQSQGAAKVVQGAPRPVAPPPAPQQPAPATSRPNVPEIVAASADDGGKMPQKLSAPRDGKADDLKLIKGVGPKLEEVLHAEGIYHFDQIAAWSGDQVAWMDENLTGFRGRVSRDDWVGQAREFMARDKGDS